MINVTNMTNITAPMETINVTEAPVEVALEEVAVPESAATEETASRFTQLSNYTAGTSAVLGKGSPAGYSDVTNAGTVDIFSRDPGVPAPSIKVTITRIVDTPEDKYVQVTNEAVGDWDLTGWMLGSAGNVTFVFPAMTLEDGTSVRVHEGSGAGTPADIYTNSTAPLWIDNVVSLMNAEGTVISSYDVTTAPAAVTAGYVDPWAGRIQY